MTAGGGNDTALTLAAVVVTYNRRAQIEKTVARLLQEPCEWIFVVDNGSDDGTREWLLAQDDPRLRPILSDRNLGGAGGFELGMRRAVAQHDPDWIVLMDDDARPLPGCFDRFRKINLTGWGAVATAVYFPNGGICEMNRPTVNPFWRPGAFFTTVWHTLLGRARHGFHISDADYAAGPREIDATSFVGLFLSRDTIAKVGYPDGDLFIYGDDVLYTLGLRAAGLRIAFQPDLRFEHEFTTFTEAGPGVFRPLWKAYYTYRNGITVYQRAAGRFFWLVFPLILACWFSRGRHYGANRKAYYRILRQALADGFRCRASRSHTEIMGIGAPRAAPLHAAE